MKFFIFLATLIVVYGLLAQSYAEDEATEAAVADEKNAEDIDKNKAKAVTDEKKTEDIDKDKQPKEGVKPETEKNENDKQSKDGETSKGNQKVSQDNDKEEDNLTAGSKHKKSTLREIIQSFKNERKAHIRNLKTYLYDRTRAMLKAFQERRERIKEENEKFHKRMKEIKDSLQA